MMQKAECSDVENLAAIRGRPAYGLLPFQRNPR